VAKRLLTCTVLSGNVFSACTRRTICRELPEDARKRYDEKLDKLGTKVDDRYATMPLGAQSGASSLWMMSSGELRPKVEYPLPRQYPQSLHEGAVEGIQKYGRL